MQVRVILYTTLSQHETKQVAKIIANVIPHEDIEVYQSFKAFSQRLRTPVHDRDTEVLVLFPGTRSDLADLGAIRRLFHGRRVVVITYDCNDDTTTLAHRLQPRLIVHRDDFGLTELKEVLAQVKAKSPEGRRENHVSNT